MGASASSRKLANRRTYYLSSFLFATPTWKEGAGRLLDFGDSLTEYNTCRTPDEADLLAMWLDWRAVGQDLRDAMIAFTTNYDTLLEDAVRRADRGIGRPIRRHHDVPIEEPVHMPESWTIDEHHAGESDEEDSESEASRNPERTRQDRERELEERLEAAEEELAKQKEQLTDLLKRLGVEAPTAAKRRDREAG
jgi:hypothetical protein